jgi:hypothetical protein
MLKKARGLKAKNTIDLLKKYTMNKGRYFLMIFVSIFVSKLVSGDKNASKWGWLRGSKRRKKGEKGV